MENDWVLNHMSDKIAWTIQVQETNYGEMKLTSLYKEKFGVSWNTDSIKRSRMQNSEYKLDNLCV